MRGLHGIEERRARRRLAAVVRRDEDVARSGAPPGRRAPLPARARCRRPAARCGRRRRCAARTTSRSAARARVVVRAPDAAPRSRTPSHCQRWPATQRCDAGTPPQRMAVLERARAARRPGAPSTARAPPTWSLSRWLSIRRSRRRSPARAQQRHQHALPGVALARIARAAVVTAARARACAPGPQCPGRCRPQAGRTALGGPRHRRREQRRARAARRGAARARAAATRRAAGKQTRHLRPRRRAAPPDGAGQRREPASASRSAAAPATRPGSTAAPARCRRSASGVIDQRHQGIAIRLASMPTIETCWKITSVSGVRPSVAMTWVRRPRAHRRREPRRPAAPTRGGVGTPARRGCVAGRRRHQHATATNDSQKPGCVNAQGSTA